MGVPEQPKMQKNYLGGGAYRDEPFRGKKVNILGCPNLE
jgi:hypothetical protein